jgi:hypothetical protein
MIFALGIGLLGLVGISDVCALYLLTVDLSMDGRFGCTSLFGTHLFGLFPLDISTILLTYS